MYKYILNQIIYTYEAGQIKEAKMTETSPNILMFTMNVSGITTSV